MKKLLKKNLSLLLMSIFVLSIMQFSELIVFADTSSDFTITGGVLTKYNGDGGAVVIPSSVKAIGFMAFDSCQGITSIVIPDSVTSIGDRAFQSCKGLTNINIPNSVTSIDRCAFYNCNSLESINIPSGVTKISESTFGYTNLTSITIPNGVTSIDNGAFYYCDNLESINIPNGVTNIGRSAFTYCHKLTNVTFPSSLVSIGDDAFQSCSSLTSINIPDGVTNIGRGSFSMCTNLSSINVDSGNKQYISDDGVLLNKDKTNIIAYPAGNINGYYNMPNTITNIDEYLFGYNINLTNVRISDSVTSISDFAFKDCANLTSVTIPNSVKIIGDGAFYDCTNLTSIIIPSSVKEIKAIGNYPFGAFTNCPKLTIYGEPNSYIETYAKKKGIKFKVLNTTNNIVERARLGGANRYGTSARIAQVQWGKGSNYAVLANGENYPDALSATPLAKKYNAPILLTQMNIIPTETINALNQLKVKNVFIIGGTGVISTSVENQLSSMGIKTTRIFGSDRYETDIKVAEQLDNVSEIAIVTGEDFPDALSMAPIASKKNMPIILVQHNAIPEVVKAYILNHNIAKTYVIGAGDVLDNASLAGLPNMEKIDGKDKYQRNLAIIEKFKSELNLNTLYVATGENFADALSGSVVAGINSNPVLLLGNDINFQRNYFNVNLVSVKNISILGGTGVISDGVIDNFLSK